MDPHNKENYLKKYEDKSFDKLQSKAIFNNPIYLYIFKRTEKIVSAIYLVTNLISDSEPLKSQIRHKSLQVIDTVLSFKRTSASQFQQNFLELTLSISHIASLIKIGAISEQISFMNNSIIQQELSSFLASLENLNPDSLAGGMILPEDFFKMPEHVSDQLNNAHAQPSKAKGQYKTSSQIKDTKNIPSSDNNIKDNRKDMILKLLQNGKPLGIKDFVREIKDCSEKTIQRELLAMVESGVLKKTGERRWSTYSLV